VIKSNYINDVLQLILDRDEDGLFAKQQIPYLTEIEFEYTSSGLFVYFKHDIEIENFKTTNSSLVLDGVKIKSDEHKIEGQATLFFKDGFIDNLEIWCYEGNYPKNDLTNYILAQTWLNLENKSIIR
jgi:hypothetical protein